MTPNNAIWRSLSRDFADYFLAAIFMSLAWSLRGQFGHLKGALIPGAVAAVVVSTLVARNSRRNFFGRALIFSSMGFSLGGHLSYGRLIENFLVCNTLPCFSAGLFNIFLMGAVWGGLGLSFLGFALSEKPLARRDIFLFATLGLCWFVPLGILNQESWDLFLFGLGLSAVHLYNLVVKRSRVISIFGFAGIGGFGLSFALAVLILYAGHHHWLKGLWPWWSLRDQMIGILGGTAIAWAVHQTKDLVASGPNPDLSKWIKPGLVFLVVFIPALNTYYVFQHWFLKLPFLSQGLWWLFSFCATLTFAALTLWIVRMPLRNFYGRSFRNVFLASSLFFVWGLSLLATVKEIFPLGWTRWEASFTLFLIYSLMISILLPLKLS